MELLFRASTFVLVFSTFVVLKYMVNFLMAIFSNPPKPIEYTERQLVVVGSFLSYIITYLIFF